MLYKLPSWPRQLGSSYFSLKAEHIKGNTTAKEGVWSQSKSKRSWILGDSKCAPCKSHRICIFNLLLSGTFVVADMKFRGMTVLLPKNLTVLHSEYYHGFEGVIVVKMRDTGLSSKSPLFPVLPCCCSVLWNESVCPTIKTGNHNYYMSYRGLVRLNSYWYRIYDLWMKGASDI